MILLSVSEIRKYYGPDPVLDGATFDVRPGERICLVGPNGAGKTTLLKILAGLEEQDAGSVTLHGGTRIGLLEQQPQFEPGKTVWDLGRDSLADLIELAHEAEEVAHRLSAAVADDERRRLGQRFDFLQQELHRREGYHLDHRIAAVLEGLGFTREMFSQEARLLSGGQQNRLLLARLLLSSPEVMLLDEPSNHLDIEATEWLEDFLVRSSQAILVVSHDRYFLDKVATRTLELYHGTIDSYPGNFTAYRRQKDERILVQRRTWEKQQEEIAKMEDFIRRNHYGQKASQAEDRRKKLERIERVDLPREIAAPPMGFPEPVRTGDIVLRIEGLAKGFSQPLFSGLTFDILRGEKWGILGPNGAGKTTLLRCILGLISADAGRTVIGAGVKIGYFDQLLACVADDLPPVDAIRPGHKETVEGQRRDLLARFGLTGDIVFQPIRTLSGGERNRAALAKLSIEDANFLILDEPTNHLDLWARGSLEAALKAFAGTVLLVSHDRYFLNQVCDRMLVMEPPRVRVIEGNYDTWRHLAAIAKAESDAAAEKAAENAARAEEARQRQAGKGGQPAASGDGKGKRRRKFPYRKIAEIEAEIEQRENRVAELHESLAKEEVLRDGAKVKAAVAELDTQQQTLSQLYEHLQEASEMN